VDGDDSATFIVAATEEAQFLAALELVFEGFEAAVELGEEILVDLVTGELLASELFGRFEVAEARFEVGEVAQAALEPAVLGGGYLGGLGIVPEVGRPQALFERGDLVVQARGVKDSSAASSGALRRRAAARGASRVVRWLRGRS
jgi:hypothetical protein